MICVLMQNAVTLLREAAKHEAEKFKKQELRPSYFILHKYAGIFILF